MTDTDEQFGELMMMGPLLYHWKDDDETTQAYLNLDHVVGCQIEPEHVAIDPEHVAGEVTVPRKMSVVLSTGVVNVTENQEQIDSFMAQWVVV